jgi:hypothetical protein
MKKNQKGFSAVEGLLILVIAGLIGFVGWYVWQAKNNADDNLSSATETSNSTQNITNASPYYGWKIYTSQNEKFSFKYPKDWKITSDTPIGNLKEEIGIQGPNNFLMTYSLVKMDPSAITPANHAKSGNDNNPNAYDPNSNVYNGATELSIKNFEKKLYIVIDQTIINDNQPVQGIGISENKTYTAQKYLNPMYYEAKNTTGYMVQWFGAYAAPEGGPVSLSYDAFVAKPEVATAKLILHSISY